MPHPLLIDNMSMGLEASCLSLSSLSLRENGTQGSTTSFSQRALLQLDFHKNIILGSRGLTLVTHLLRDVLGQSISHFLNTFSFIGMHDRKIMGKYIKDCDIWD